MPGRAILTAPFFEIGPKSLLRRPELEALTRAAGAAGVDYGVSVILTVPTALIAPIRDLDEPVLVFSQTMDPDPMGAAMGRVFAESLVDAGACGVMLNHESRMMVPEALDLAVERASSNGLLTILCAGSQREALDLAVLQPTIILLEPHALIGVAGPSEREWIAPANEALRRIDPSVLMMHAGGVSSPTVAEAIMASGADGTGSTSGVLNSDDPPAAARAFIRSVRTGWDRARKP